MHNFIVVPLNQNVSGHNTEDAAIKGATQRCRERREEVGVYRLVKTVAPKVAPVEIKDVSF